MIHYPYHRSPRDIARVVLGIFALGVALSGGCLVCPAVLLLPTSLVQPSQLGPIDQDSLEAFMFLCISILAFLVLWWYALFLLYRGLMPYEARLGSETFAFGRRGRVKELRLAEIVSVTGRYESASRALQVWGVTLRDQQGQEIRFLIGSKRWPTFMANFEYQQILLDLLPPFAS